jgi:hypothetical protein
MASPGKRKRKKMGVPAPEVQSTPEVAPVAPQLPKPKKKRKSIFDKG